MESNTAQPTNLPIVIIDTNIFGNLLDVKTIGDTFQILLELSKSYEISISKITIQEIISKGTKDVDGIISGLRSFKRFEVDDFVLVFAGLMTCIGVKGSFDSIIASTAFLNGASILTGNQKDFPEPFFTETKSWSLTYKDNGNRTVHQMIHLLLSDAGKTLDKINNIEYVQEVIKKNASVNTDSPTSNKK